MPYKKTHPGLDSTLDDAALDEFIYGIPLALEEPSRRWPTIVFASAASTTIGLIIGNVTAGYVSVVQVLIVVAALAAALITIAWADRH